MPLPDALPPQVRDLMQSASIAEYATISAAGVPIDTPVLYFSSEDLRTLSIATGLSYPAKAERARRNPKVGMLIEGGPDDPVVQVAGMAAVRDSDLQSNVDRYLSEAGHSLPGNPNWSLARQAVWYWTRIFVEITVTRVLWWTSPGAMDATPQRWEDRGAKGYPQSDPEPAGEPSKAPKWEQRPWEDLAGQAVDRGANGHLTWIDGDGYPVPIRARSIEPTTSGFTLELPRGLPSAPEGKACLTFQGIETFVGEVVTDGDDATMRVDRALPEFPMTKDMSQLWEPTPDTRTNLMRRLRRETERRGQPIPAIPIERPAPSAGYQLRLARRSKVGS